MSRFNKIIKRAAIGFGLLVAIGLIVNAVLAWQANRNLESRLAEIRAAGDPTSIADLAANPPPPEENAAVLLKQIQADLKSFDARNATFCDTPIGKAYMERTDQGKLLESEQIAEIAVILDSYPQIAQGVEKIVACPRFEVLLKSSDTMDQIVENVSQIKPLARFLDWRMNVLTAQGKYDDSVQSGIDLMRIARKLQSSTGMTSYLTAIACRGVAIDGINKALRAGPISPELRARLDEELACQDDPQRLSRVMKAERAFSVSQFEPLAQQIGPRILSWVVKNWQIDAIDCYANIIALSDRPWCEVHSQIGLESAMAKSSNAFVSLLIPALQATFNASNRDTAMIRSLRILNALSQYAEKNGREASGLESLGLPEASTIDPFTGKPLKLKSTDDGWVIYSLLTNGIDDNGDFKDLMDYGIAPAGYPRR